MSRPHERGPGSGRGLSLEYKVPLLITVLLAAILALSASLAYNEVRSSTLMAANERLQRVALQLAELVQTSVANHQEEVDSISAHPDVVAVLTSGDIIDNPGATEALDEIRSPSDSLLPVDVLRAPDREIVFSLTPFSDPYGRNSDRENAAFPEAGGYGPLHQVDGRTYYWVSSPITDDGRTLGFLVQLRSLGDPDSAEQVEELIGPGASIFLVNSTGGHWTTLDGSTRPAPNVSVMPGELVFEGPDGTRYLAHASPIPGTPWLLLVEQPMSGVTERASTFFRQIAFAFVILLLLGAAGAWLLSRGFIRPLKELSRAAGSIAGGDYSKRVAIDRNDEIGALSEAFNRMGEQVEQSHADLQHQFTEAQELAEELEQTNDQMQVIMGEMEIAREEAESASRAKSDFLATVSHEIRTPINAIIGYTDLLLLGIQGPLTEQQNDHLERVRSSGKHLVLLIDEVLDLARIESGQMRVELATGSSNAALEAALSLLHPQAAAKGIQLASSCNENGDLEYRGDPKRVEQILVNLLANAIKFTDPGGKVTVSCAADKSRAVSDSLLISVVDTGIGIPVDKQNDIFEPFIQAESGYTRGHGGAGLGLAISRRFARIMGGDLTVRSSPGTGSNFTLRLPAEVGNGGI